MSSNKNNEVPAYRMYHNIKANRLNQLNTHVKPIVCTFLAWKAETMAARSAEKLVIMHDHERTSLKGSLSRRAVRTRTVYYNDISWHWHWAGTIIKHRDNDSQRMWIIKDLSFLSVDAAVATLTTYRKGGFTLERLELWPINTYRLRLARVSKSMYHASLKNT